MSSAILMVDPKQLTDSSILNSSQDSLLGQVVVFRQVMITSCLKEHGVMTMLKSTKRRIGPRLKSKSMKKNIATIQLPACPR